MISSLLVVTMLHMAPANSDGARKAYTSCMSNFARESAKKQMKPEEFDSGVGPACATQEAAFRKASVEADVARSIPRRAAEQGVSDDITDMKASAKERFVFELELQQPAKQE